MNKFDIFSENEPLLFSVAYNMLGSVEQAKDIVQDTYLKWNELDYENISYPKAYLVRITTNKCIDQLKSAKAKRENYVGVWLPEPVVNDYSPNLNMSFESYPTLSFGILVLLEKLSPLERAVFILRELFVYDYREIAEIISRTEDNCRQIFRRAKQHLGNEEKRFKADIAVHERVLNHFIKASVEGDMDGLINILKEDIVLLSDGGGNAIRVNGQKISAVPNPVTGRRNVAKFVSGIVKKITENIPDFNYKIVMANGQPSLAAFMGNVAISLITLETNGEVINNIYIQTNPDKLKALSG
jgi:RNA polymerase sigma-70 factor (ECF subfamily)